MVGFCCVSIYCYCMIGANWMTIKCVHCFVMCTLTDLLTNMLSGILYTPVTVMRPPKCGCMIGNKQEHMRWKHIDLRAMEQCVVWKTIFCMTCIFLQVYNSVKLTFCLLMKQFHQGAAQPSGGCSLIRMQADKLCIYSHDNTNTTNHEGNKKHRWYFSFKFNQNKLTRSFCSSCI